MRTEITLVCQTSINTKRNVGQLLLQVSIQHLMFGRSIQEATDSARVHHQLVPNELQVEPDVTEVSDVNHISLR